jgi:hypothetical protein
MFEFAPVIMPNGRAGKNRLCHFWFILGRPRRRRIEVEGYPAQARTERI